MTSDTVRIVSIGGIGEIGKNCTVIEYGDDAIVLDCGITFPDADMFGVDLVLPNFSYLREIRHKLRAFVITHGHEDHIGALPYALREFDVPVFGSRLTMGLVGVKIEEAGLEEKARLQTVAARESVTLGAFRCEWFHVCHSIPDAMGIAVHTPIGTIVHTGDFKLDHTPVDGIPPDFQTLGRLGSDGVLLLMSDSTYADHPGHTPSEAQIADTFARIFEVAPGRIIVATFSSLISRVQQVVDAAHEFGRRVCFVGRSMERNVRVASELGYLHLPENDLIVDSSDLGDFPAEEMVVICTGSQGEPRSALVRIANRDHRFIDIIPDDTVIVSATAIPGNEEAVNKTIDRLGRQGARVLYERLLPVHVSGHGSQEDLKYMLSTLQPKFFMPVHGEFRHLEEHRRLAVQVGVDEENILVAESGSVVHLTADGIDVVDSTDVSNVFVDGLTVSGGGDVTLRDRRHLSEDGVVVAVVNVDRHSGKCLAEPDIIFRGFVYPPEADALLDRVRNAVRSAIEQGDHPDPDPEYLQDKIRKVLGRQLYRETRRRPVILPIVTEV
ncbi:MAG: ribonuclease J [Rhodospirillaceae bacterium]|nr:ribonuclease J [Rhodospirillaceae bacterium]HCU72546.1 ribonuclease J [Chloroflexota bacterium]